MSLFSNANEKRLFLIKIEKKKLSLLIIYARSRRADDSLCHVLDSILKLNLLCYWTDVFSFRLFETPVHFKRYEILN